MADESSEAAAGSVDGGFVGGQAEEFVQFVGAQGLLGPVVEEGQELLVGVRGSGRLWFAAGPGDVCDDLSCAVQFRDAGPGLVEADGEVVDLSLQSLCVRGGLVLFVLELSQEFVDVHAAAAVSRQAGVGVVSRRAMFAVAAQ